MSDAQPSSISKIRQALGLDNSKDSKDEVSSPETPPALFEDEEQSISSEQDTPEDEGLIEEDVLLEPSEKPPKLDLDAVGKELEDAGITLSKQEVTEELQEAEVGEKRLEQAIKEHGLHEVDEEEAKEAVLASTDVPSWADMEEKSEVSLEEVEEVLSKKAEAATSKSEEEPEGLQLPSLELPEEPEKPEASEQSISEEIEDLKDLEEQPSQPEDNSEKEESTETSTKPEYPEIEDYFTGLNDTIGSLQRELKAASKDVDITALKSIERRVKDQIDNLERTAESYKERFKAVQTKIDLLKERVGEANETLNTVKDKIKEKRKQITKKKSELRSLERKVTRANRDSIELDAELKKKEKLKNDRLSDLDAKIDAKEQKLDEVTEELDTSVAEHKEELRQLRMDIQEARNERDAIHKDAKQIMERLEEREEAFLQSKHALQEQVSEHKQVLSALKETEGKPETVQSHSVLDSIKEAESALQDGDAKKALAIYNEVRESYHKDLKDADMQKTTYQRLMNLYEDLKKELS